MNTNFSHRSISMFLDARASTPASRNALTLTAPLNQTGCDARDADACDAAQDSGAWHTERDEAIGRLHAVKKWQYRRAVLSDAFHRGANRIERVALHAENGKISNSQFLDAIGRPNLHHERALRRSDLQPPVENGVHIRTAGVEHHFVSGARELSPVISADCSRAEYDDLHSRLFCRGDCSRPRASPRRMKQVESALAMRFPSWSVTSHST